MRPQLDLRAPSERLFIGGEWTTARSGGSFDSVCSATGEVIAPVAEATAPDVDLAVQAAHGAFSTWSQTTTAERYDALMSMASRLRSQLDRLTLIEVVDVGATISRMKGSVGRAVDTFETYAGWARHLRGSTTAVGPTQLAMTLREPLGVVAQIIPFNVPLLFAARAIATSLVTGNTVVLKPSEYTPLTALELAELTRDVLPAGTVNVLTGYGESCGVPLVAHDMVRKVHFRGSMSTGRQVRMACAARDIPCSLELGGKNPLVVYPDADIPAAVRGAIRGLNLNNQGQSCGSPTRLLVHDDVYDEFRERLVAGFADVRVGLPWDSTAQMGSIVSGPQYNRVLSYLDGGTRSDGCRLLIGGGPIDRSGRPDLPAAGLFIEPTVFEVADPTLPIATEEVFGPVTCLFRWNDESEMLRLVNGLDYGLTASVWTHDLTTAHRTARRVQAGTVWINQHGVSPAGVPRGGWKASGVGKEGAIEEIESYTQEKTVIVHLPESQREM